MKSHTPNLLTLDRSYLKQLLSVSSYMCYAEISSKLYKVRQTQKVSSFLFFKTIHQDKDNVQLLRT